MNKGNSLHEKDFEALGRLHETFPYFSIPHILAAKYQIKKSKGESMDFLHWASVQSVDRIWLKQLIEKDIEFLSPIIEEPEPEISPDEKIEITRPTEPGQNFIQEKNPIQAIHNREEILKKLQNNLNRFRNPSPSAPEDQSKPDLSKLDDKSRGTEDLIETIKKREKKEILDARQREQNNLIKAFSKKSIKLVAPRDKQDEGIRADLSRTSTLFNDNIISESFAKLLVQQEKKEKAIEIYHKLMLKFPNKSAYFADLIKQLEEKNI